MLSAQTQFSDETLDDLSDYFHGAPIGLQLTGPDGTITRTNLAELELLGYRNHMDEYVGHHLAEFHADADAVQGLLDRLVAGEPVAEHETTLLRRDGSSQKVLLYANARVQDGEFHGVRCCTFPHPEDLRPDIAEVAALTDQSVVSRGLSLTPEERSDMYWELHDFFEYSPVNLHIVGGDGLIKHASRSELASMGYDSSGYIGQHIARFHADQAVIDGMLEDLVGGTPLVNFGATLFHKDGSKLPVMIYSNSRMRDGSFVNTRCFTVPVPKSRQKTAGQVVSFAWPRNEDFGFTIPARQASASPANPMTVALKYIASRKRPEESLGFLAHISQVLGSRQPCKDSLAEVAALSVPFLADFTSIDLRTGHLVHANSATLSERADGILRCLGRSTEPVPATRETEACFDLSSESQASGERAAQLLRLGLRSLMRVPLTIREEHVGTLTLLREDLPARRNFGAADRALAEELARRLSFALEIERLSARD